MYYRDFYRLDRRNCKGSRSYPDLMMFSSYDTGKLQGFFSNYERYNDSDVSVSYRPRPYDIDITIHTNLDRGDSWCHYKMMEAMEYVKNIVIENCAYSQDAIEITLEVYTA